MTAHAERTYPEEACGGLLGVVKAGGSVDVWETVPLANARQEERCRRYLIGPDIVRALERRAGATSLQLVGYYHSHPDAPALPSSFDRDHAWPWYTYVIVSVESGQAVAIRAWRLADDRTRFDPVRLVEPKRSKPKAEDR